MTVTTPSTRLVRGGVLASKIHLALKVHHRLARARARILHIALRRLIRQKVIVIVLRPGQACPAGSKMVKGRCAGTGPGKG
jgi:hypothetical protein